MGEIKMIPSLKPKIVRTAIAGLVILIATLIYAIAPLWKGHFQYSEIISWQLICVLQIIGGIFLLIGSLIDNHCLFLPWLGSSVTFIYTIFFRSFMYLRQDPPKPESFVPYFHIIVGVFWIYFVYDIFGDFLQMYYESKERNWDIEASILRHELRSKFFQAQNCLIHL
ncbi:uncharacterized protein LOC26514958 [Drosophila ananassae]|nr:uncharacterized protein LOC26514958 [Drosophila ananassae]